jgi:hypothetical protein
LWRTNADGYIHIAISDKLVDDIFLNFYGIFLERQGGCQFRCLYLCLARRPRVAEALAEAQL